MSKVKCYVCNGVFEIEQKYRNITYKELKRKKHHIAKSWVKKVLKRALHCPYCGAILLDSVLKKTA